MDQERRDYSGKGDHKQNNALSETFAAARVAQKPHFARFRCQS
jgi:hypothetical protein